MPKDIKTDYQNYARERATLTVDPTVSSVFPADGCQSVTIIHVAESSTTGDAVVPTIEHGDQSDGSDMMPIDRAAYVYPQADAGSAQFVGVIEFVPSKPYFRVSVAGVSNNEFLEVLILYRNCRAPGVGAEKPLVPDGLKLSSIACTLPDPCATP